MQNFLNSQIWRRQPKMQHQINCKEAIIYTSRTNTDTCCKPSGKYNCITDRNNFQKIFPPLRLEKCSYATAKTLLIWCYFENNLTYLTIILLSCIVALIWSPLCSVRNWHLYLSKWIFLNAQKCFAYKFFNQLYLLFFVLIPSFFQNRIWFLVFY